jgi:hypothetical protein
MKEYYISEGGQEHTETYSNVQERTGTYRNIQERTRKYRKIQEHTGTYRNIEEHTRTSYTQLTEGPLMVLVTSSEGTASYNALMKERHKG